MILTTFSNPAGNDYLIERSYISDLSFTWWHMCLIQSGRTFIVRETEGFGGYRVLMRFKENFWDWNSSGWMLPDIIEDWYAMEPVSDTPITCPPVSWRVQWSFQLSNYLLAFSLEGQAGISTGQRLPVAPPTWYKKFAPRNQINVWQVNDDTPAVLYPPPVC
jgi:hypothetical protein